MSSGVKEGRRPFFNILPLPLVKGKGIKGMGLKNNLKVVTLYADKNYSKEKVD